MKPEGWPFFSGSLGVFLLALGIWAIVQSGLVTFVPLFLVDNRGFSIEKAAAIYGIMSLSSTLCRPFLGALMDRMGRRKPVIIAGFAISSLSIIGLAAIDTSWMLYGFIILLGALGTGHSGLADTLMIEMIPSARREETLGFVYTVRMGIAAVTPVAVGFASEQFSLPTSFLGLAAIGLLTVSLFALIKERPVE